MARKLVSEPTPVKDGPRSFAWGLPGEERDHVGLRRPGDLVEISVRRGEKLMSKTLTISGSAESFARAARQPIELAGAKVSDLPVDHPRSGAGVLVRESMRGTPAWRGGLRTGDVVTAVNRRPVASVSDVEHILEEPQGVLALQVLRGTDQLLVIIS